MRLSRPFMARDSKLIALTRSVYVAVMSGFVSSVAVADAQLSTAPQLEPAVEHLLRNSAAHESVISILRVNEVVDRDTFVNMFDSVAAVKEGAADLGFNLTSGGLFTQTRVRSRADRLENCIPNCKLMQSPRLTVYLLLFFLATGHLF